MNGNYSAIIVTNNQKCCKMTVVIFVLHCFNSLGGENFLLSVTGNNMENEHLFERETFREIT